MDLLLLVGSSTKIPFISEFIEKELGVKPQRFVGSDLAVVKGTAIQTGIINGIFGEKRDIIGRCLSLHFKRRGTG